MQNPDKLLLNSLENFSNLKNYIAVFFLSQRASDTSVKLMTSYLRRKSISSTRLPSLKEIATAPQEILISTQFPSILLETNMLQSVTCSDILLPIDNALALFTAQLPNKYFM